MPKRFTIPEDWKIFVRDVFLFLFSFYTTTLFFPLVRLPFQNPYGIISTITEQKFNPSNDYLGFALVLTATPVLFFGLRHALDKGWKFIVRGTFIFFLTASFFLSQTAPYIARKAHNLDMFHDGEQLGTGSAVYHFNQKPFQDIFFLHGAFADPLITSFSFKIFGASIGSHLLVDWVLTILSLAVLLSLVGVLIKDEALFYLSSLFLYGAVATIALLSDVTVFLFIFLAYLIAKDKIKPLPGFFLTSFLSFSAFYISAERGLYLSITNLALLILYLLFQAGIPKKWSLSAKTALRLGLATTGAALLGLLAAGVLGIAYFGWDSFKEFGRITFLILPKISPLMFDFKYPAFSVAGLFPYWLPILLTTASLTLLVKYWLGNKWDKSLLFPLTMLALSIIFYRRALGRNDIEHILYTIHFVFLTTFVSFDLVLKDKRDVIKGAVTYLAMGALFFLPFFSLPRAIEPPSGGLRMFATLPEVPDEFWLTEEQVAVRDFILKNTAESEYVFVFNNESAYYYLFQRKNPTRFYTIWFAVPDFLEDEALSDLEANRPKYIIYDSSFWSSRLPQPRRINSWILENYQEETVIGSTKILSIHNP